MGKPNENENKCFKKPFKPFIKGIFLQRINQGFGA
jgi:hypothetical protein